MKLALGIVQTDWQGGPQRLGGLLGDTIAVADHFWLHLVVRHNVRFERGIDLEVRMSDQAEHST
jgi:hypothetical protein